VKVRTAFAVGEPPARRGAVRGSGGAPRRRRRALVWLVGRDATALLTLLRLDPSIIPYARDFFAAVTFGAPATERPSRS